MFRYSDDGGSFKAGTHDRLCQGLTEDGGEIISTAPQDTLRGAV